VEVAPCGADDDHARRPVHGPVLPRAPGGGQPAGLEPTENPYFVDSSGSLLPAFDNLIICSWNAAGDSRRIGGKPVRHTDPSCTIELLDV
jgi:hypothetical protein